MTRDRSGAPAEESSRGTTRRVPGPMDARTDSISGVDVQITAANIDQLNPPTEAVDFMRHALTKGHTLWAGWDSARGGARLFSVHIDGPGWDIVATWRVERNGAPYLASALIWQDATAEWEHVSLDEARKHFSAP